MFVKLIWLYLYFYTNFSQETYSGASNFETYI